MTTILIEQTAKFASLPFDQETDTLRQDSKRTFVAFSKESMSLLASQIVTHASQATFNMTAVNTALESLAKPITLKYDLTVEGDTIAGKVKLGMFGTAKLTGERIS